MRLTEINVDQFGIWQDLNLKLTNPGITVLYGPNETGKSTLMRFLKGMFYGFQSENQEGSISISQNGNLTSLHRKSFRRRKNHVSLTGYSQKQPHEKFLESFLGSVNESLFESIYAIGLEEIQKLGTLQKKDVGSHIFGNSLGPEGQALLNMSDDLQNRKTKLYHFKKKSGLLNNLLETEKQLADKISLNGTPRKQYEKLSQKLNNLQKETEDLNSRQSGMNYQLRGHEYMKRVHEPWRRTSLLERKLSKIPLYPDVPVNSLEKINHIDEEVKRLKQQRVNLKTGFKGTVTQLKKVAINPLVREQISLMAHFVKCSGRHFQKQNDLKSFQSDTESLNEMLEEKFGDSLTENSLTNLNGNNNPANHVEIMNVAEQYRGALARRSRLGKRYKAVSKRYNQHLESLEEIGPTLQGEPVAEILDETRYYLETVKQLKETVKSKKDLTRQLNAFLHQADHFNFDLALPAWAKGVLTSCVLAGIFFFVWGMFSEREAGWIEGISYALLGITCGGLVLGMKNHFDSVTANSSDMLEDEIENLQNQLAKNENEIHQLQENLNAENIPGISEWNYRSEDSHILDEQIQFLKARIVDLEVADKTEVSIQEIRIRLTKMRTKLKDLQAELGEARQNWCLKLKNSGLQETVSIKEGLDQWNLAQERNLLKNNQNALSEKRKIIEAEKTQFENDVQTLWRKLNPSSHKSPSVENIISGWETELQGHYRDQNAHQKIYIEYRNQKKNIREINRQVRKLSADRTQCLKQAGVRSRPQLERRIKLKCQSEEIKTQLKEAQRLLESVCKTEPEMAIVEEDLKRFNPKENQESIDILILELDEIVNDLQKAHERKGALQKELDELGNDRSHSRLIYQKLQLEKKMKTQLENWVSNQLSLKAGDRLKRNYEKNFQPEVLSNASKYLSELTGGKYHNIWTQLGENNLCIDDQQNQERQVEELSRGTCEQLFLAVRLATIDQFKGKSIQLPLILDDVMVNYDQARTEAAVETLIHFAEAGNQVLLFTCHLHLAEMFRKKGIEPVWLHTQKHFQVERKAG